MSILGLDIGTTGTKGIVFNEDGRQLASSYKEYSNIFPRPGWVEFDVNKMWDKIFSVIREINSHPDVVKDPVTALSVSTIGESFTPVDNEGNALYNTIYSTDARSLKELEILYDKYTSRELFEITGYPSGYICPLNKIIWMKNNRPDIYKKTKKFLFTQDLLYHKLGIKDTRIDYSLSSRTLFFDIKEKCWSEKILDSFDIDVDLFSKPVMSGTFIGYVGDSIARDLGFKGQVSVVAGAHDQTCAALGVGAVDEGIVADGMGTVECLSAATRRLLINDDMFDYKFNIQSHAVKDTYLSLGYNLTAGSSLKWYRDNLASHEKRSAEAEGKDIYDILFANIDHTPSGLLFLPYFAASGPPYFDPSPKASLLGLNLSTTKNDIFKALVEGLVFEINFISELMEKTGLDIKEFRAVGGGSKSEYWLNLKSSVINKPVKKMKVNEAGCLATMMLAGSGTGKFKLEEAIENFVKIEKTFYPDNSLKKEYEELYEKYKKIYPSIKSLI